MFLPTWNLAALARTPFIYSLASLPASSQALGMPRREPGIQDALLH
jgi:hypothetical protein